MDVFGFVASLGSWILDGNVEHLAEVLAQAM
jgi:hypothetical protein